MTKNPMVTEGSFVGTIQTPTGIANLIIHDQELELQLDSAYCVGYSGRDRSKVDEHIAELAKMGIPEPAEVPVLYPVRVSSLAQSGRIQVLGQETSGEAEIVLVFGDTSDDVYVTVGSDHTDRSLETVDINKSKQICDKPFANHTWKLSSVIEHWDQLELVSHIEVNDAWELYQQQTVSVILRPEQIIDFLKQRSIPLKRSIVFAGTVPLVQGFSFGTRFSMKLVDPVLGNEITSDYLIDDLLGGEK